MEKIWNNRQIRLLLSADADAAERFLQQFGPVIYTWMYYQVGADAAIALDLTGQTLSRAIGSLSAFDPARETLFQWFKECARQSRDEGLQRYQIHPQRPWAWSKLPEQVLTGLSRFRTEILDDATVSNSYVHEIVQAVLTELEARDRELLIRRFCHLDTAEHIAEEMDCRVEDVQNWLYRSRHSFRRVFFQIITSVNPGFAESSDTGEIEIQDTNLEKLLSTTTIYQQLDDVQMNTLRIQLLQATEEAAKSLPEEAPNFRLIAGGIAAVLIVLIITVIFWAMRNGKTESVPSSGPAGNLPDKSPKVESVKAQSKQPVQEDINGEELKVVMVLGQAGNVEALLEILKSGQFTSQVAAAHFLGKLADPDAIDLLEQAESHWYAEPTDDNPFAKAIAEILARFPEAAQATDTKQVQPEPKPQPETKEKSPSAILPNITGIVSDFMNQPVANAVVELMEKPLYSKIGARRKIASVQTATSGQFQFADVPDGPVSLAAKMAPENASIIRRSLWCKKDSISVVNIGGKPALTGTVAIDNKPLADQRLYLSDTLDIANASFAQEILTDTAGNFSFLGVPPGTYSLLYKGLDNRMHRVGNVNMPGQDVFVANLDLPGVTAFVDYVVEPNQPMPIKALLAYTMDISEDFYHTEAIVTADGVVLFEAVLPGSYVLKVQFDNSVWIQQGVEIFNDATEQTLILDPVPEPTVTLSGRLLGASPVDLFLTNANQRIHIDIEPNADGSYDLRSIPPDVYSLAAFVKGQLIEFTQIDLQEVTQMTLDIDPAEMMPSFSPLYVIVTDPLGQVVSGAQVWLTSGQKVDATSSTGQGAFLAAVPGSYTLSVALPGYPTLTRQIELKASTLLTEPNSDNTLLVRLEIQESE